MTEQEVEAVHFRQIQVLTLVVTTILLSLCYISFTLRLLSRRLLRVGLWWDDKWMGMVLVCLELLERCHVQTSADQYEVALYLYGFIGICWSVIIDRLFGSPHLTFLVSGLHLGAGRHVSTLAHWQTRTFMIVNNLP